MRIQQVQNLNFQKMSIQKTNSSAIKSINVAKIDSGSLNNNPIAILNKYSISFTSNFENYKDHEWYDYWELLQSKDEICEPCYMCYVNGYAPCSVNIDTCIEDCKDSNN